MEWGGAIIAAVRVTSIEFGADIGARRSTVVICIIVREHDRGLIPSLNSISAHTAGDVPLLVCDQARTSSSSREAIRSLERECQGARELLYVPREDGGALPLNVNRLLAMAADADVVLLEPGCMVADGWLDGLQEAARLDSRVATAMPLTTRAVDLMPQWPDPGRVAERLTHEEMAAAVRSRSLRLRPRLPAAGGPCLYLRRSALELAGELDPAFLPGAREEARFSRRCVENGLFHVLADDVLVWDQVRPAPHVQDGYRLIGPPDDGDRLRRSLSRVRRTVAGMSVVIDARILGGPITGTSLHVLEVIMGLHRTHRARLTVLVPDRLNEDAARALESATTLSLITSEQASALGRGRADLVHRPFQVSNAGDLMFLAALGERLILTHQDLIAFHNPSYFPSRAAWEGFRRVTRSALATADRVVFFSEHARDDATAEDLVEPARASVVHIGIDHPVARADQPARPPGATRLAASAEAILCIGTDYRHKNRVFAIRMLEQMRRQHGWDGFLLLAGPHVAHGSSRPDEAELLTRHPQLAHSVIDLGPVDEAGKAWLLGRARLVVYPTTSEGFGLVPFEAAHAGLPCMWAPGTSLSEILPNSAAEIVTWHAAQSADHAVELLHDDRRREQNVAAVRAAGKDLTWNATATRLVELYEATCDAPSTPAGAFEHRDGALNWSLSEDALRLVGPGGELPVDVERPLLALATHPQMAGPVFGALKLGYRAAYRLRRNHLVPGFGGVRRQGSPGAR